MINIFKFGKNNEDLIKKRWVKNAENDKMLSSDQIKSGSLDMPKEATFKSRKDIIDEKK